MQISLRWINELINIEKVNVDNLINKLTLGGFEVEEVLEIDLSNSKTIALDILATANRSDSLSIQGLSLEIAALLHSTPKKLNYSTKICNWSQQLDKLNIISKKDSDCSGFIGITVENLSNFTSSKWLQQKLITSGYSVENNLIDFQNYILIETGYPLELYDFDKINLALKEPQIQLSLVPGENSLPFTASNDKEYFPNKSITILQANKLPISIAGIISSKDSTCSKSTKTLLVEASIFTAAKIRQKSRQLGLRTERSSRYEKALKNINLFESVYRFISLLRIKNPNLICKLHTITKLEVESKQRIRLNYTNVRQVLGPIKSEKNTLYEYISPQIITDILRQLQFQVNYNEIDQNWDIYVPALRSNDITREIDIIEEIGRIYGFNNFFTRLPPIKTVGQEDYDYQIRKKITSCLTNLGLHEIIQYSLVNSKTYLTNEIKLINPLVKDYSNLRTSLLPNLLIAIKENIKKGNSGLEGFEYGHVFSSNFDLPSNVEENEVVAGVFGGLKKKSNWAEPTQQLSWFDAKGKMEQLFKKLNIITNYKSYEPIKEKTIFHIYRTTQILSLTGKNVGLFGQVSPVLANQFNLPTDIYLFEFNFKIIKEEIQTNKLSVYREYSLYPKIVKDVSFIVQETTPCSNIKKLMYLNGSKFLQDITLLDEYRGAAIPLNHKSLCFQLTFQSDFETLQNDKVEVIVNNLTHLLIKTFNAIIRI